MEKIVCVSKRVGQTPLKLIELLKKKYPVYERSKITYAGRLDPMATGLMILLVDEMIEQKKAFLALSKTYEFETVFGISTDSYDLLGMPEFKKNFRSSALSFMRAKEALMNTVGLITQSYPPFSGKTVNGIKLFDWFKSGKTPETWPSLTGEIYSMSIAHGGLISISEVVKQAIDGVAKVRGDFRQEEIIELWKKLYLQHKKAKLLRVGAKMSCSSGIFVRSICFQVGNELMTGGMSYSIHRTRIGGYTLDDCIDLEA